MDKFTRSVEKKKRKVKGSNETSIQNSVKKRIRESNNIEIPAFLDHYSSVSSSTFGTARLQELKNLWKSVIVPSDLNKQNGKTSSLALHRNQRRRTTSHTSKRRHRFPNGKNVPIKAQKEKENATISRKGKRQSKIDLIQLHLFWKEENKSKWLMTHLWNAKRFYMSCPLNCYSNFRIPIQHTQRGTKASIQFFHDQKKDTYSHSSKATIQDATYELYSPNSSFIISVTTPVYSHTTVEETIHKHFGITIDVDQIMKCWTNVSFYRTYPTDIICVFPFLIQISTQKFLVYGIPSHYHEEFRQIIGSPCTLVEQSGGSTNTDIALSPISWLRLRGGTNILSNWKHNVSNKAATLQLKTCALENNREAIINFQGNDDIIFPPHGTMIPIIVHPKHSTNEEGVSIENNDDVSITWNEYLKRFTHNSGNEREKAICQQRKDRFGHDHIIWVISHCPNSTTHKVCNLGVTGWDVLIPVKYASEIYQSLIIHGNACPIGYVDYAAASLEADPPLPQWPRDYPDTLDGQDYYFTNTNNQWSLLRKITEYTVLHGGRMSSALRKQVLDPESKDAQIPMPIDWTSLVNLDGYNVNHSLDGSQGKGEETIGHKQVRQVSDITVVRGNMFKEPFVQAMRCALPINFWKENHTDTTGRKKLRRKVSQKHVICVPPLRRTEREVFEQHCKMLLSSLSLPALLRCHVILRGKGTIHAGSSIIGGDYDAGGKKILLGHVVLGAFSLSRGRCHGIGFISAKRFLFHLTTVPLSMNPLRIIKCDNQIAIQVSILNRTAINSNDLNGYTATLTIL